MMPNPGWLDVFASQFGVGLLFTAFAVGAIRLVARGASHI
jgi:hypothetical protein